MATRTVTRYTGVASFLLGVIMFIIPYPMDAVNRMIRSPQWWETNKGVVAYFWGSEMLWGAVGLLVLGLVLAGTSYVLKD
jgi:hypothetical protein